MDKLDRIWKQKIIAMLVCVIIAVALVVFPHTHPAALLVANHQNLTIMVHQMPYVGFVMLLIASIFWFEAFSAAFHGARAMDSVCEEVSVSSEETN